MDTTTTPIAHDIRCSSRASLRNGYQHATLRIPGGLCAAAMDRKLRVLEEVGNAEVYSFSYRSSGALCPARRVSCLLERRYDKQLDMWWLSYPRTSMLYDALACLDRLHGYQAGHVELVAYRHVGRLEDEMRMLRVGGLLRKQLADQEDRRAEEEDDL